MMIVNPGAVTIPTSSKRPKFEVPTLGALTPTTLVFSTQPSGAVAGEPFTTQPVVTVKDQFGATLTSYTGQVTMAMDIGSPGVLTGTTTKQCVAGVATFTNLEIDEANVGVRIAATIPELFPTTFASAPFDVEPAVSPLLTDLISYWKLDEVAGTRADAHGTNDLTDNNTVGSDTGKINLGASFIAANSEYLSHADNASLSTGDIDFTFGLWVRLATDAGMGLITKWDYTSGNREFEIIYLATESRFKFYVSPDGTAEVSLAADSFGAPSLDTYYYVVVWHDSVANTINIQVNNGVVDSLSHSGGVFNSNAPLHLGAIFNVAFLDGRIDEVAFWKRVLTAPERASLYNAGAGLAYPF